MRRLRRFCRSCRRIACRQVVPDNTRPRSLRRMTGVTLLEALVALAACAMFVTLLLPSISSELKRVQLSRLQAQAAIVAARQVELLSVWPSAEPKPREGVDGPLRWSVMQVKADRPGAEGGAPVSLRHFRVTVHRTDDPSPLVDMVVRRLGDVSDRMATNGSR
jgi:hypothetical protein